MSKKKEYPGYLLYFDRVEGLMDLPDADLGRVSRAIFFYARDRKEPTDLPKTLLYFWPMLRRMLDEDRNAYEEKCRTKAYAASVKAAKDKGEPVPDRVVFNANYDKTYGTGTPMTEDEFEKSREEKIRMAENYGKL